MKSFTVPVLIIFLCALGMFVPNALAGGQEVEADTLAFLQGDTSTHSRAVFAHYLVYRPNPSDPRYDVDCAISVSNICSAPASMAPFIGREGAPVSGKVTLYLYNSQGKLTVYSPASGLIGSGLEADGTLAPGHTWTVRLKEVLDDAGYKNAVSGNKDFSGYAWILSEFDCLAGTYNNTIWGLGFTQNFEMLPGMGQGGFLGGFPVPGVD